MADFVRDSLSVAYDLELVLERRRDALDVNGAVRDVEVRRNEVDLGVRVKVEVADTRLRTAR